MCFPVIDSSLTEKVLSIKKTVFIEFSHVAERRKSYYLKDVENRCIKHKTKITVFYILPGTISSVNVISL